MNCRPTILSAAMLVLASGCEPTTDRMRCSSYPDPVTSLHVAEASWTILQDRPEGTPPPGDRCVDATLNVVQTEDDLTEFYRPSTYNTEPALVSTWSPDDGTLLLLDVPCLYEGVEINIWWVSADADGHVTLFYFEVPDLNAFIPAMTQAAALVPHTGVDLVSSTVVELPPHHLECWWP